MGAKTGEQPLEIALREPRLALQLEANWRRAHGGHLQVTLDQLRVDTTDHP
jgi:hypothetical protein